MNKLSARQQRLRRLADYLDTVKPKSFDMTGWIQYKVSVGNDWPYSARIDDEDIKGCVRDGALLSSKIAEMTKPAPKNECGFVACAIGHACSIPAFRKAGLKLAAVDSKDYGFVDKDTDRTKMFGVVYQEGSYIVREYNAIAQFFDISSWEAEALFGPYAYKDDITPKQVANVIRRFLKGLEKGESIFE